MSLEIKVPPMGESISEATVADWHKQAGDSVSTGDILVELETDKVTMEVPCPVNGVLKEIKFQTNDIVKVDDVLAIVEEGEV
ncbi:MAG: dihydrolipoamide succinyltransferase, partial [Leptonema sp. (in: Bacteria)]|nr:dihydrolipoamide succinyltransferase [Leptonema sp. (in: bacteria)]